MDEKMIRAVGRRRAKAKDSFAQATEAAQHAAREATAEGHTEVDLAAWLGVDRMTVRSWIGKKR